MCTSHCCGNYHPSEGAGRARPVTQCLAFQVPPCKVEDQEEEGLDEGEEQIHECPMPPRPPQQDEDLLKPLKVDIETERLSVAVCMHPQGLEMYLKSMEKTKVFVTFRVRMSCCL
jgi:hypothetical protein